RASFSRRSRSHPCVRSTPSGFDLPAWRAWKPARHRELPPLAMIDRDRDRVPPSEIEMRTTIALLTAAAAASMALTTSGVTAHDAQIAGGSLPPPLPPARDF